MAVLEKPWYQSSTIWLNLAAGAVFILDSLLNLNLINDAQWLAVAIAAVNILNRFRTQTKVTI